MNYTKAVGIGPKVSKLNFDQFIASANKALQEENKAIQRNSPCYCNERELYIETINSLTNCVEALIACIQRGNK